MFPLSMYVSFCKFFFLIFELHPFVVQLPLKPILVSLHLVDPTLSVAKIMVKLFALVFLDTLEPHQLVDQNVSLVLNVLKMKLAIIKSV
jgi:hypothetical protein